jgi:deferrochelatase/peroxidase EfeB
MQEALVGRDKLSGCPLQRVAVAAGGALVPETVAGCPMTGELPKGGEFVTIPVPAQDRLVLASHVHRANLTRGDPAEMSANRIFRQGYEFVDSPPEGGVRVGLNFVGFQNDFDRVRQILDTQNWLRDANFGGLAGDPAVPAFELMRIVAGGYFLVPPVGDPFPGHDMLG